MDNSTQPERKKMVKANESDVKILNIMKIEGNFHSVADVIHEVMIRAKVIK